MTRLEDRLQRELAQPPKDGVDEDFVDLLATRIQDRRRRRVFLLAVATIIAAIFAAGLIRELATLGSSLLPL